MQALSAATSVLARVPGVKAGAGAVLGRVVKGSTGGPDEQARARSSSYVIATAFDAGGAELAEVRLTGVDGYTFTADVLAWGADLAAAGGLQGIGALGPVDAFGLDVLEAGAAEAGLAREQAGSVAQPGVV
jgi:short subunit dehydrogenase-like uncharacterized protein